MVRALAQKKAVHLRLECAPGLDQGLHGRDAQAEYLGDALRIERTRFPAIETVAAALGGRTLVERLPTPADCTDGFVEAFWNRPEAFLDADVCASQSMWPLLEPGVEERVVDRLRADLDSGAWDTAHGHLRHADSLDGALRLVISEPN